MERGLTDLFFGKRNSIEKETDMDKKDPLPMEKEQAYAVPYTNRRAWSDFSILETLNPGRLARILRDVRSGECPAEYLELAQDMELKDLHYRSVLSTRKDAVCKRQIKVIPASEEPEDIEIAEAVRRDIIENTNASLKKLIRNMLDGLAKGFSVNEIIWDTGGKVWKPKDYKWRDARWFQYDKETGETLMLRDPIGNELHPLAKRQFVVYEPHLISGTQVVSGLALPALFYFMLKSYDITSWAAFLDRYGYPIRLGKYGKKATEDDIKTLKRAVASIGTDFGAVIPESAIIEIIEAKMTGDNSEAYQKMAVFVDKQLSKLVLGQTMTTDEGSSRAQSQTHEEVRSDIADSDVEQICDSLLSQLVVWYVKLNYGAQDFYPHLELYEPDIKSIEQTAIALEKLCPLGLSVPADEVRALLGFSKPKEDEETIGVAMPSASDNTSALNAIQPRLDLNAAFAPLTDKVDKQEDENSDDYIEISEEIAAVIEKAADKATDFSSFQRELESLVVGWKPDRIAQLMAIAFFKARAAGDSHFDIEEDA